MFTEQPLTLHNITSFHIFHKIMNFFFYKYQQNIKRQKPKYQESQQIKSTFKISFPSYFFTLLPNDGCQFPLTVCIYM